MWWRFVLPIHAGRIPTPESESRSARARALSRPGPAWNDELAAASRSTALAAWKAANSAGLPAARATSPICVLLAGGMPMPSRTASAVIPIVRPPTMSRVSQRVILPKRRRPASSSCPSWAIAEDGASTPVASAMPTGKASITENRAKPDV